MNIIYPDPIYNFISNFCDKERLFPVDQIPYIQDDFSVWKRDRLFNVLQKIQENEPPGLARVWHIVRGVAEYAIKLLVYYFGLEKEKTVDPDLTCKFVKFVKSKKLALKTTFEGEEGLLRYRVFEENFKLISERAEPYQFTKKDEAAFAYIKPSEDNFLLQQGQEIKKLENEILEKTQRVTQLIKERKQAVNNPLFDLSAKYRDSLAKFRASASSPSARCEEILPSDPGPFSSLRHIVISGGGAKGVVLPSAFRTLFKKIPASMQRVENLIGSSVGAFTAALIATGVSREGLKDVAGVNFDVLLGMSPVLKDGENLKLFIRECIRINFLERLSEMPPEMRNEFYTKCSHMSQAILGALQDSLEESRITFAMLSYLREIDPKTFKNLIVTATKRNGEQILFSAEKTPNDDIATACRASMSIPGVFQSVKMDSKQGPVHLFDGGIIDNTPIAAIPEDRRENMAEETLVIVFENKLKEGERSIFDPQNDSPPYVPTCLDRLIRDLLPAWLIGLRLQKPNTEATQEILQNVKQNCKYVLSFPMNLLLTDFAKATKDFRKYGKFGKKTTELFLEKWASI